MATDPVQVARASYQAYVKKDRAAIEKLIAPDFRFTSPLDNRIDRKTYFERCWPNSKHIAEFQYRRIGIVDDCVVVTYVGRNLDGSQFQNTEVLTIQDSQIIEVEVYFGWSLPHKAKPGEFVDAQ